MDISSAALEAYRVQQGTIQVRAQQFIMTLVRSYQVENPTLSPAEIIKLARNDIEASLRIYNDQAAQCAIDFLHDLADKAGVNIESYLEDVVDYDYIDRSLTAEGNPQNFLQRVAAVAQEFVHRSAQATMIANCDRNKLRFARVPSGLETCEFCFMLASRGFVYHSEKTAGWHGHEFHPHCDCVIIPGVPHGGKMPRIAGYDPEGMKARWQECVDAIGGYDSLHEKFDALPREEKAKYYYDRSRHAMMKIFAEVRTRDTAWLYTGKPPKIDYRYRPRDSYGIMTKPGDYSPSNITHRNNDWRDLFAIDTLQKHGFRVTLRPQYAIGADGREIKRVTNPDIFLNDRVCEIKSPIDGTTPPKDPYRFIQDQIRNARNNFRFVYDVESKQGKNYTGKKMMALNLHYKNLTGMSEPEIERQTRHYMKNRLDEVVIIYPDGRLRRIKEG